MAKCMMLGCAKTVDKTVWIIKGGVAKKVCQRCAEELTSVWGWQYREAPKN